MSCLEFDALESAFVELICCLDGQNPDGIQSRAAQIVPLLNALGSTEDKLKTLHDNGQLDRLMSLIESARIRVNKLTDMNRHRVDILAPAFGFSSNQTYQKP